MQPLNCVERLPSEAASGRHVCRQEADAVILEAAQRRGGLGKSTLHEHAYPNCWRCETRCLITASTSWFIAQGIQGCDCWFETHESTGIRGNRVGRSGEWLDTNTHIDWAVFSRSILGKSFRSWVCWPRMDRHAEEIGGFEEHVGTVRESASAEACEPHKPRSSTSIAGRQVWAATDHARQKVSDAGSFRIDCHSSNGNFPFEIADIRAYDTAYFIAEGESTRPSGWFYRCCDRHRTRRRAADITCSRQRSHLAECRHGAVIARSVTDLDSRCRGTENVQATRTSSTRRQ